MSNHRFLSEVIIHDCTIWSGRGIRLLMKDPQKVRFGWHQQSQARKSALLVKPEPLLTASQQFLFRLTFVQPVDTLSLARHAGIRHEMIDRFHAAPLQGEMNIGELRS